MRFLRGLIPFLVLALAGCFNFEGAYDRYCQLNKCSDGGTGGGAAGGSGGGAAGGGAGGGGVADAGPADAGPPTCDAGLCFVRSYDVPKLQMWSVWAVSPTNVFAGGFNGTVVRFDGNTFAPTTTPLMTGPIWGVHGAAPTNVWAVGSTGFNTNQWNGASWVPHTNPAGNGSMYGVYGLPNGIEALSITSQGQVLRWTGTAWTVAASVMTPGNWFEDIHGCDGDDAWLVTYEGSVYRYSSDGGMVREFTGTTNLDAVYCHPTTGVWAVGSSGLVLARDNDAGSWSTVNLGLTANLNGIYISSAGEPWIVGSNRTLVRVVDGGAVSYNLPPYNLATFTDVAGTGDSIWVTGLYSQSATFDGGVIAQYLSTPPP